METILLASEHRNHQYYMKKSLRHESASSKSFRQINCRTFQSSGIGLLPKPKRTTSSIPIIKEAFHQSQSPSSPKSVLSVFNSKEDTQICRSFSEVVDKRRRSFTTYSELWAGPTYSNSPPPTSVPIPKFSLKQKRTVSLSFEDLDDIHEVAKSAPVSPTSSGDTDNNPFHCTVSATMTLRRMLNLETGDDE